MCGIAGFYGLKDDALIRKFSRQLKHRGPDGEGIYSEGAVTLLSRRLAIIDIQGGDQPIFNEDKSLAVVYNGEIYNFRELRTQLERNHTFTTHSDTEVIVHAFEEWGLECFNKLNGMFGIAIYDIRKKELILARDHFGIKPLYIADIKSGGLMFASEITPLVESGLIARKPNERILYRYLKYRIHDDNEETFFKGVKRLMPGQALIVSKDRRLIVNYSHLKQDLLEDEREHKLHGEDIETFKKKLEEAVRLRLISDVRVGTCLSGGLDSSTIVAMVNRLLKSKVKEARSVGETQNSFSAVFPSSANDEERYVDAVLEQVKPVRSHKVTPTPEEFFAEIEEFVRTQEEPTISTGPYAQYKVMEKAKGHVKVLLDGQGADEMMAGYIPYYATYLRQLLTEGRLFTFLREAWGGRDVLSRLLLRTKKGVAVSELLREEFSQKYTDEGFTATRDSLKERLVEDIFHNSLPALLRYEDKNSMHFSIEGRVPFLDVELVKYIFSLPDEAIIRNGWNKYILRRAVGDYLPHVITKRRNKIGFTTPEHEWFMRMKNRIYEVFLSESFASRPYFDQQAVLRSFREFIEGKNDDTLLFWRLLNTELWLREYFDEGSKKKEVGSKKANSKVTVDGKTYSRELIKTEVFARGDDFAQKISKYVTDNKQKGKWFVAVSEKVVAIAQGRSYFLWEIKPGFFARHLSKFVTRTPYGIGLGSPWTMQLAIQEAGLGRILTATLASILTKPLGIKGVFYRIAGHDVNAIDGPTEYSLYPSNVSAKLAPENPENAAQDIHKAIAMNHESSTTDFQGVVIIDANDLGVNILGNSTGIKNEVIEQIFKDNPMGQSREQTPITRVSF